MGRRPRQAERELRAGRWVEAVMGPERGRWNWICGDAIAKARVRQKLPGLEWRCLILPPTSSPHPPSAVNAPT